MSRRRKTRDYTGAHEVDCFFWPASVSYARSTRFRVRIYEAESEMPAIVVSEFDASESYISIADHMPQIAAKIVLKEFPERAMRARRSEPFFHLVEHLPKSYDRYPETDVPRDLFELIEFDDYRVRITNRWHRRIKSAEKALEKNTRPGNGRPTFGSYRGRKATREEVERIIGMTLDDTLEVSTRALPSDLPDLQRNTEVEPD